MEVGNGVDVVNQGLIEFEDVLKFVYDEELLEESRSRITGAIQTNNAEILALVQSAEADKLVHNLSSVSEHKAFLDKEKKITWKQLKQKI